jgi:hypothetical protein
MLIGSLVFLVIASILKLFNLADTDMGKWAEIIFLLYVIIAKIVTEVYVCIKIHKYKAV